MKIGCILMAAGAASRFGGNKLLASFEGMPIYRRALTAVPSSMLTGVAVVSGIPEILESAAAFGFMPVVNDKPEAGVSRSIRLGMEAFCEMPDALVFMVADQPCLKRESVEALLRFAKDNPGCIARLAHKGKAGNPVLFPREFFPALLKLDGDTGGGAVIRANQERLRVLQVDDPLELMDVDSRQALIKLESDSAARRS